MHADILTQRLTDDTRIKSPMKRDYLYSFKRSLDCGKTVSPELY